MSGDVWGLGGKIKIKNKRGKMRQQQFVSKRMRSGVSYEPILGRNHNIVRHSQNTLGRFSSAAIVGVLVLIVGLIYVAQGTKTSGYDYELSALNKEIAEMTVKRDDLTAMQARLTSVAESEKTDVAKNMKDAKIAGFVNN